MRPVLALLLVAAAIAGCQPLDVPSTQTASGVVVDVDAPNVARVDRFTLRTNSGEVLEFDVGQLALDGGGKPAPHLREHLASGTPITVEYVADDGRNQALRYYDAP